MFYGLQKEFLSNLFNTLIKPIFSMPNSKGTLITHSRVYRYLFYPSPKNAPTRMGKPFELSNLDVL